MTEFARHVTLPSGGEVTFRDPKTLRAKDKKRAIQAIKDPEKVIAAGLDVVDGLIALLVESWTIPYLPGAPLPSAEIGLIGELEIPDYDALTEAVAPARELLFPQTASPDRTGPGSPTVPASA